MKINWGGVVNKPEVAGRLEVIKPTKVKYIKTPEEINLEACEIDSSNLEPLEGDEEETGTNINFIADLDNDSKAFLKIFDPDRSNVVHHEPEQIERASYVVSQVMGFDLVPTTVVRQISTRRLKHPKLEEDGRTFSEIFGKSAIGILQEFIEHAETLESVGEEAVNKDDLMKLYIFDYVTANWDRHSKNVLKQGKNIFAIDNEGSFFELDLESYNNLINNLKKVAGEPIPLKIREIFNDFQNNKDKREILKNELSELLPEEYVNATFSRINQISKLLTENQQLEESAIEKLGAGTR